MLRRAAATELAQTGVGKSSMEPQTEPGPAASAPRRRRRSSRSKAAPSSGGLIGLIRRPGFGRALFAAILLLAAFYLFLVWREVAAASGRLGPVAAGMTGDEVLRQLGTPDGGAGGKTWRFSKAGRNLTIGIDDTGRVAQVSCREAGPDSLACPAILGVRVGASEQALRQALGQGTLESAGDRAIRSYPGIGARVEIDQGQVSGLTVAAPHAGSSIRDIALWRLLP